MQLIEYEQPTSEPVPKVKAAGLAGVVVTAIVTVLTLSGVIVPNGVSHAAESTISAFAIGIPAIQTVITFVAAYLKKDKKTPVAVKAIETESVKG